MISRFHFMLQRTTAVTAGQVEPSDMIFRPRWATPLPTGPTPTRAFQPSRPLTPYFFDAHPKAAPLAGVFGGPDQAVAVKVLLAFDQHRVIGGNAGGHPGGEHRQQESCQRDDSRGAGARTFRNLFAVQSSHVSFSLQAKLVPAEHEFHGVVTSLHLPAYYRTR